MEQKIRNENSIKAFSIASMVFGILSLVTCCTGILPLTAGGLGILFVVLSHRKGQPLPVMSIVGLVLCIIGILIGLFLTITTLVYMVPILRDPQAYQELNTFYQNNYGISLDEMLNGWNFN